MIFILIFWTKIRLNFDPDHEVLYLKVYRFESLLIFHFLSLNSEWEKNRMVLSLIKQKKTIDLDNSKKNFFIENLFSTIFFLYIKYYIEKILLDERVVLDDKGIYFKLIFVSNTISLIVNFSNHQNIFCKINIDSNIFFEFILIFYLINLKRWSRKKKSMNEIIFDIIIFFNISKIWSLHFKSIENWIEIKFHHIFIKRDFASLTRKILSSKMNPFCKEKKSDDNKEIKSLMIYFIEFWKNHLICFVSIYLL